MITYAREGEEEGMKFVYAVVFVLALLMACLIVWGVRVGATVTPCEKAVNIAERNLGLIPYHIDDCKKGMCYKGSEWQDMLEALQYTKEQIDSVPDCFKAQGYRDQVIELIKYLDIPTPHR